MSKVLSFFIVYVGRREPLPNLMKLRKHCLQQLAAMRTDHMRALNPTPYKVLLFSLNPYLSRFFRVMCIWTQLSLPYNGPLREFLWTEVHA
jgi:hypothetical protein